METSPKPPLDRTNCVFDFYGTLVDVRTDENKPALWRFMADWYAVHGCLLPPDALRDAFWQAENRERETLRRRIGLECPEIRIERVFLRLLLDSPARPCAIMLDDSPVDRWRSRYARHPDSVLQSLQDGEWACATARTFRILSRDWLRPYPDSVSTLCELLRRGKRLFLLSNAQAVFTRPEIGQTGLEKIFPFPFLSSERGMAKPQREFLDALLRRKNLDPGDTVVIGNEMRSDMAIAVRCGTAAVFLNSASLPHENVQNDFRRLLSAESASPAASPLLIADHLGDLLRATRPSG
jgi:putative hydrolase of the HAD superfamily